MDRRHGLGWEDGQGGNEVSSDAGINISNQAGVMAKRTGNVDMAVGMWINILDQSGETVDLTDHAILDLAGKRADAPGQMDAEHFGELDTPQVP